MNMTKFIRVAVISTIVGVGGQAPAQETSTAHLAAVQQYGAYTESTPRDVAATPVSSHLAKEVRHEIVTLPYYNLFDWLEYEVLPNATVVLRGQVVRPTTKSDAESRIKRIEGVASVSNQIEVLPLSPMDDRLRFALYRAVLGRRSPLSRYAAQPVSSIHIIVMHGRATLKGVVSTKADSDLANIKANGVEGLFEVKNELRIENNRAR